MHSNMENKASSLVLGTVQFGLQYGINSSGRPAEDEIRRILREAYYNGVRILDTSSAYGDSETILGRSMENDFRIVSKYPECDRTVSESLERSLKCLRKDHIYGYLLHHFSTYRSKPYVWDEMISLKRKGLASKIGFSLYAPDELEIILNDGIEFDLLQIPFNIFDRRFAPYLPALRKSGVEIHARSTFLQGLFFKDRDTLPPILQPLRPYLQELDRYVSDNGMSISEAALNFNIQNPCISGVLIGVDNVEQLRMNLNSIISRKIELKIDIKEKELLNPVNWKQ